MTKETAAIEQNIQKAIKYVQKNPDAKISHMARDFAVSRHRLTARLRGRASLFQRPPSHTLLSKAEEVAICRYIDRLDRVSLSVRKEFVRDAANYII